MTAFQTWLQQTYPNKQQVTEIIITYSESITGDSLVISDYLNLVKLECKNSTQLKNLTLRNCPRLHEISITYSNLTQLDLTGCPNLTILNLSHNQLSSIDFLTTLTNPEKLSELNLTKNNFQPTSLDFCHPLVNLKRLILGSKFSFFKNHKNSKNCFVGSLKPLRNLTKLEELDISETDLDSGLEYLPDSLITSSEKKRWSLRCDPGDSNTKVKSIQDQLRPFNYDLVAWRLINVPQLANRSELLTQKIKATQQELTGIEEEAELARCQSKLKLLEAAQTNLPITENLLTELSQLKQAKSDLDAKLAEHDTTLTNYRQKLEQLNSDYELLELQKENGEELQKYEEKHREAIIKWIEENLPDFKTEPKDNWDWGDVMAWVLESLKKKEQALTQQQAELANQATKITELQNTIQAKESELIKLRDQTSQSTSSLRKEIDSLKKGLQTIQSQSINRNEKIITLEGEIQQLKEQSKNQTDLESQLTALALSSGLLSQQCENLTNQLSDSEQKSQRKQFELEIKENLIKDKDISLSQQEQKIDDYQALLRRSEESLSKAQQIIQQKSDQLEQLEGAKNDLAESLAQSGEKIKELETSLLNAQTKISELENQIKELEQKGDNSSELTRLRQELVSLKSKSQSEINDLKTQLQQAKLKESELNKKIQNFTVKKEKIIDQTEISKNSYWENIKTSLFYGVIIIIMLGALSFIRSKLKFS